MANLLSNAERWAKNRAPDLIKTAKTSNKNWVLAERTVEAVTPSLMKVLEGYVSEAGDIEIFLYVALDPSTNRVLASIVEAKQNADGFQPCLTAYDQEAKELIAAFLCDFPDALFSVEGGLPLILFVVEAKTKRYVTLNNMLEAAQNKHLKMCIAIPKSGGQTKDPTPCAQQAISNKPTFG